MLGVAQGLLRLFRTKPLERNSKGNNSQLHAVLLNHLNLVPITRVKHSVSLFTSQECPEISMTSNHRQNCRIGQPFTKKWFFSPDQFGPWPERKGKSGEIRSLLETLGSTLYPRKKLYLPKSYMDYNFC